MRNLIDITDLSVDEINDLIKVGEDIKKNKAKYAEKCKGKQLATLFFEPSTRTRLSFESAMLSLGGNTLGFSSAQSSSTAKGESIADTIRTVSSYVNIIAMRHPQEGAATIAATSTKVPVINAGDGTNRHPTQTLTDLMTIKAEKGKLSDFCIGMCGDLKYGRTVHSLVAALSRYENIKYVFISPKELKMPEEVLNILKQKNIEYTEVESLEGNIPNLDILYMTRVQKERFKDEQQYERLKDVYILDKEKLKNAKKDLIILHPLPRVNEISEEIDKDPRACYFKQVENGKYIRMALILKLLNI